MGIEDIRLFQPKEGRITGLKCFENMLYALSARENGILVYKKNDTGGYSLSDTIPCSIKNASGITTDGKTLFVADGLQKAVYSIDLNTKQTRMLFDMRELKDGNRDSVINAKATKISDMEIYNGEMWITCSAGYSSCIYRIDMESRKIVKVISARGPEPESISLDAPAGYMRVLDSSNREISSFSFKGEWTGQFSRVPVDNPACFSIDTDGNPIVVSRSSEMDRKDRRV